MVKLKLMQVGWYRSPLHRDRLDRWTARSSCQTAGSAAGVHPKTGQQRAPSAIDEAGHEGRVRLEEGCEPDPGVKLYFWVG